MPVDTDESLVDRLIANRDGAFEDLIRRYQSELYAIALRICGDRHDAEDLLAETLLRTWRALGVYSTGRIRELRLRPWMITVLLNLWRNEVRYRSRRPAEALLDDNVVADRSHTDEPVERFVLQCEANRELKALLKALPADHRRAVVMRHVVGMSIAEIAVALRCPEGTAKSNISRGLNTLRRLGVPLMEYR